MLITTRRFLTTTLLVGILGCLVFGPAGCSSDDGGGDPVNPPPPDVTAPGNVASLLALPGDGQVSVSWINPQATDLAGVMLRRSTGSAPALDTGVVVFDGLATSFVDHAVTNDSTYFYSAFSYDNDANYATGVSNSCTPHVANTVVIADANLEFLLRAQLGIPAGDITDLAMLTLTNLDASGQGIADLQGLQYALNLVSLDLDDNGLSDAGNTQLLGQLTQLESLHLSGNAMTILPDLSDLTRLEELVFDDTPIVSLAPLALVPSLTSLQFTNCPVSDLTPLEDLTNLDYLFIMGTAITDLAPLAGLTNLTTLVIRFADVGDLTPLAGLTNLEVLSIVGGHASQLSALSGLTSLTSLDLSNNGINELPDLSALTQLRGLTLAVNGIEDLSRVAGLSGLSFLNVSDNPVRQLPNLAALTGLETIVAFNTELADIGTLADLPALASVNLSHSPLTTEDVQAAIPALTANGVAVDFSYDADLVELMGHWTIAAVVVDGVATAPADFFGWDPSTVRNRVVFYPHGDYTAEDEDSEGGIVYFEAGSLAVAGNTATVTVTSEDGSAVTPYVAFTGTWLKNAGDLVFSGVDGGTSFTLTWTR